MNIIFVSNSMAKPKKLTAWHISSIVLALVVIPAALTYTYFAYQQTAIEAPSAVAVEEAVVEDVKPENQLLAYVDLLGELQARINELDEKAARLENKAGKSKVVRQNLAEIKSKPYPGVGGPLVGDTPPENPQTLKKK